MFLTTVKKLRLFLSVIIEDNVVTALLPICLNSKLPLTVRAGILFGPGKQWTSFQSTHKFPMFTHTELGRWKLQDYPSKARTYKLDPKQVPRFWD